MNTNSRLIKVTKASAALVALWLMAGGVFLWWRGHSRSEHHTVRPLAPNPIVNPKVGAVEALCKGFEVARYYFRGDGTLAKLACSYSPGVHTASTTQIFYYDARHRLLQGQVFVQSDFDGFLGRPPEPVQRQRLRQKIVPSSPLYRQTKALPFYRLLRASKPKPLPPV